MSKNFAEDVRNVLRRQPEIIVISETRDVGTIAAAITASKA